MVSTYEHFVAFGVDNAGLERLLRLIQSTAQIAASLILSSPFLATFTTLTTLTQLQSRLNITRRWMRLFRFLPTLNASLAIYSSKNKKQLQLDAWTDVLSKSCLGVFGLLESATLFDLIRVDGLEVFGLERAVELNQDAQVFWFLGLAFSVLSSALKISAAYSAAATTTSVGEKEGEEKKSETEKKAKTDKVDEKKKKKKKEDDGVDTEALWWKLIADGIDLCLPGTALKWFPLTNGVTGVAMWCSSVLTGMEVWKRIGSELERRG